MNGVCRTKFLHPHVTNSIEIINKQTDKVYRSENRIIRRRSQVEKKHRSRYQHFLFVSKGIFVNFMIFFFRWRCAGPDNDMARRNVYFSTLEHTASQFSASSPPSILTRLFSSSASQAFLWMHKIRHLRLGNFLFEFFFSPNDCFYVALYSMYIWKTISSFFYILFVVVGEIRRLCSCVTYREWIRVRAIEQRTTNNSAWTSFVEGYSEVLHMKYSVNISVNAHIHTSMIYMSGDSKRIMWKSLKMCKYTKTEARIISDLLVNMCKYSVFFLTLCHSFIRWEAVCSVLAIHYR